MVCTMLAVLVNAPDAASLSRLPARVTQFAV